MKLNLENFFNDKRKLIKKEKIFLLKNHSIGELDSSKKYSVFMVPIKYLILNPKNSRFQSEISSFIYEKRSEIFELYSKDKQEKITTFVLNQPEKDNFTEKDIAEKDQQIPGIITSDGVIVDGNRRYCLLKKLYAKTNDQKYAYFKTVILNDLNYNSYNEIKKAEISVQFGQDNRISYKKLDTMLAIRDGKDMFSYTLQELKEKYNYQGEISDVIPTVNIMEEYLEYTVDNKKFYYLLHNLEKFFLILTTTYKNISKKNFNKINIKWFSQKKDLTDYKTTIFNVLRIEPNWTLFQSVFGIKKKYNIFSVEKHWRKFYYEVRNYYENAVLAADKYKDNSQMKNDFHQKKYEKIFQERSKEKINKALNDALIELKNVREKNAPKLTIDNLERNLFHFNDYVTDKSFDLKEDIKKKFRRFAKDVNKTLKKIN